MTKLCDNLLMAEKQNYVVNTKDHLFSTMESIMLLVHVKFSMNNMRTDWIKNSLQNDLSSLCEAGNRPTTLLLGDDHLKMTYLTSPISMATIRMISKTKMRAVKQRIIFCPNATNAEYDISNNTKKPDNTGINKHSKTKKKILLFPEMRVTKKIFTQAAAKKIFFMNLIGFCKQSLHLTLS